MSDPTVNCDILSILSIRNESPAPAPQPINSNDMDASLDDSALAVVDQWTEKTEKEESMDQWVALNDIRNMVPDQDSNNDNEDTVTNCDSAMDAVEQWTQEEDVAASSNGTPHSGSEAGDDLSVNAVQIPVSVVPENGNALQEIERLKTALIQAQQEIEALETSTNLYRMQLKQAKEIQRVRSMEIEAVRSTNESQLEAALQAQQELKGFLVLAQEEQNRLTIVIEQKEQELIRLKVENHEYPSRILKLQTDLESEKSKFKSLVDRFNSIKEVELHRQKQKFLAVSAQQKEVFERLMAKYNEAIQFHHMQSDQLQNLQHQIALKDAEMLRASALLKQSEQEMAAERAKNVQLQAQLEQTRAEKNQLSLMQQAVIADTEQKLKAVETAVKTIQERELDQSKMQCYFESPHDSEPEVGDEIRVRFHDCGDVVAYEWYRASSASSAFQLIESKSTDVYNVNADDLGRVIRVVLINATGLSVSSEIGPVVLSASLAKQLHENFHLKKDIEFGIKNLSDSATKNTKSLVLTKDKLKVREGKTTTIKEPYSPSVVVSCSSMDDTRFTLKISEKIPPFDLLAASPASRDLIVLTVRGLNFVVSSKQPYKEKEARLTYIQYILMIQTKPAELGSNRSRLSQGGSFSQNRLSVVPRLSARYPSVDTNITEEEGQPNDSRSMSTVKKNVQSDDVQYDQDGYIIRKDADGTRPVEGDHDNSDDDALDATHHSVNPIVIKPKNEAVEATTEELSRAVINFDKPPTASTSKPRPAVSEKKKKKKTAKASSRHVDSESSITPPDTASPEVGAPETSKVVSPTAAKGMESKAVVCANVSETVSCNMRSGNVSDLNVVGMVTLFVDPPQQHDVVVSFSLSSDDQLAEVMANAKAVEEIGDYMYSTNIAANTASVPVLRYSLDMDPALFPIRVTTNHMISKTDVHLVIDVEGSDVDSISLLVAMTPPGRVLELVSASPPSCMFDTEQQRVCWKVVPVEPRFIAHLTLSSDEDQPLSISPVLVQFNRMSRTLSNVMITVNESDGYSRANNQVSFAAKVFQAL